jgi:hypothetical protein
MKFRKLFPAMALLLPWVGHAAPIGSALQTESNVGAAVDGTSEPVTISVLITKSNGLPADNFGDGTDLADEIILRTAFNRPALGCQLIAGNYVNRGAGLYTVELTPDGCTWVAGQYNYAVSINSVIPSVGRYRGATLGSFEIPEAPAP